LFAPLQIAGYSGGDRSFLRASTSSTLKDHSLTPAVLRATFEASRAAVQRAHQRADEASDRARRMRAEVRQRNAAVGAGEAARRTLSLAEEEGARAVRESERFIAVVSHELRQPLNAAMAAMALLDADVSAESVERAGRVLRRQLLHMSTLLDGVLEMSRLSMQTLRLNRRPMDLRTVLREALETVEFAAERAGVHARLELPATPVRVVADAGRLHQVFSNLLTNAVRYTPRGGSVTASVEADNTVATITIADTGQGISPGDLANIFEPFWRGGDSSTEGFGIGLALVRGIVELHGGSVAAFSEGHGKGARFCLTLPLAASS
jgi:signal transduction histidine kinase